MLVCRLIAVANGAVEPVVPVFAACACSFLFPLAFLVWAVQVISFSPERLSPSTCCYAPSYGTVGS